MTHPTPTPTQLTPTHLLDLLHLRDISGHLHQPDASSQVTHAHHFLNAASHAGPVTVTVTPTADGFDLTARGPYLPDTSQTLFSVNGNAATLNLTHPLTTAQFGPLPGEDALIFTTDQAEEQITRYLERHQDAGTALPLSATLPNLRGVLSAARLGLTERGGTLHLTSENGEEICPLLISSTPGELSVEADDLWITRTAVITVPHRDLLVRLRRTGRLHEPRPGTFLNLSHPRVTRALGLPNLVEPGDDFGTIHGQDEQGLLITCGMRFFTGAAWETLQPDLNHASQAVQALVNAERARPLQGGFYLTSQTLLSLGDGVGILPLSTLDAART